MRGMIGANRPKRMNPKASSETNLGDLIILSETLIQTATAGSIEKPKGALVAILVGNAGGGGYTTSTTFRGGGGGEGFELTLDASQIKGPIEYSIGAGGSSADTNGGNTIVSIPGVGTITCIGGKSPANGYLGGTGGTGPEGTLFRSGGRGSNGDTGIAATDGQGPFGGRKGESGNSQGGGAGGPHGGNGAPVTPGPGGGASGNGFPGAAGQFYAKFLGRA